MKQLLCNQPSFEVMWLQISLHSQQHHVGCHMTVYHHYMLKQVIQMTEQIVRQSEDTMDIMKYLCTDINVKLIVIMCF